MVISGIYKITNLKGEIYIGQSVNVYRRFNTYEKHINSIKSQIKLYNSIKKYGIHNHKFEIVENCPIDILNERERYYQEYYNCVNFGLNCKYTTTDSKCCYLSTETKDKISNSSKDRIFTDEWKNKISNSLTGRKRSNESIKKQINSRISYKPTEDTISKIKESSKQFKSVICPHCQKVGKQGMYRWHFDNCKLR